MQPAFLITQKIVGKRLFIEQLTAIFDATVPHLRDSSSKACRMYTGISQTNEEVWFFLGVIKI
jgi:hypothetical protein